MTDLTPELARLLNYIAQVATAIRMNSAYNPHTLDRNPAEVSLDVMWLSDSLHCFERLGNAILTRDTKTIINACDAMVDYYGMFRVGASSTGLKGNPKQSVDRYSHFFNPQEATELFRDIRRKTFGEI